VKDHEPRIALDGGGRDGVLQRIASEASLYLRKGMASIEVGQGQGRVSELIEMDFWNRRSFQTYRVSIGS
jgi:methylase of polypeptide subunit release factors